MLSGFKHLIECRCILKQFQSYKDPPLHKFVVFSVLEDDVVLSKFVQCNNCGIVHKVIDLCKSQIIVGKEHLSSLTTIDDVKSTLSSQIVNCLETHRVDLATWEMVKFIVDNERWGEPVLLSTDDIDGSRQGKCMIVLGKTLYKIESFTSNVVM